MQNVYVYFPQRKVLAHIEGKEGKDAVEYFFSKEEFRRDLCEATRLDDLRVHEILDSSIRVFRERLQAGYIIELGEMMIYPDLESFLTDVSKDCLN